MKLLVLLLITSIFLSCEGIYWEGESNPRSAKSSLGLVIIIESPFNDLELKNIDKLGKKERNNDFSNN